MECPEAVEQGRNFRLLNEDELPQLLDYLVDYLPESLKFHQTLLTYLNDRVWDFRFYVANGWPNEPICLHFPGMTLSPHGLLHESVAIFCPNDRSELLRLLRDEDILIDWSKPLYINFLHSVLADELTKLYEGTGTIEAILCEVWACEDPEMTEHGDDDSDPDVQVQALKQEHAEGIYELYPANDMECHELFLRLIKALPAAGVFVKGNLAAWMIQSYYGAMFSMQTKPEYRRKGYGTKLARYLTKRVSERGYTPFVVIRPENEASKSLYTKLSFRNIYTTVRMTFRPFAWVNAENEASSILRDNLENAVKQLNVERRVLAALRGDPDDEDTIDLPDVVEDDEDPTIRDNSASPIDEIADEPLEPIDEQPEDRIDEDRPFESLEADS